MPVKCLNRPTWSGCPSRRTGAWSIHGLIREVWAASGWEAGPLGYPISDELASPDGRVGYLQRGALDYVSSTGQMALILPPTTSGLTTTPGDGSATLTFTVSDKGGAPPVQYDYTLDGGTTWTQFAPTAGNAAGTDATTVTGLTKRPGLLDQRAGGQLALVRLPQRGRHGHADGRHGGAVHRGARRRRLTRPVPLTRSPGTLGARAPLCAWPRGRRAVAARQGCGRQSYARVSRTAP
ncbi:MAG: putative esterase [Mycobacterium sp.]|nr:putative esterase [Mycobacterium sp.]